ncbi:MAG: hypothetical protein V7604_3626 [Hyphomicrobiales bacterium]
MTFTETDLRAAAAAGALDTAQLARLLAFLHQRSASLPAATRAPSPQFDVAHLLWYAGALIVMTAMGLFSTLAFSQMGGKALAITALVYAAGFAAAGHYLWHAKGLRTPGGLLIAIAVSMAPLAVYGVQDELDLWGQFGKPGTVQGFYVWIKGSWIFMEVAAILAAVIALRFYPFPFIVVIAGVALWFMSMDLAPWIAGTDHADWETRRWISLWFGLGTLVIAWVVDWLRRGDFAFWLHLFGMLAFWGAVTSTSGGTMVDKALYCAMNVVLLFLSVFLGRKVYAVFGVIGIALYLGDLANKVFRDSLLFPFALSMIGVAVIAAGLLYYRHQAAITAWLDTNLPDALKRLRPVHAG